MKIKISEATPLQVDYLVAKIDLPAHDDETNMLLVTCGDDNGWRFQPTSDWSQGGPIIERECIAIHRDMRFAETIWVAGIPFNQNLSGPTPLIAAMRCYVASKLGEEVEIPEELK